MCTHVYISPDSYTYNILQSPQVDIPQVYMHAYLITRDIYVSIENVSINMYKGLPFVIV